jgi:hypothetical protein
MYSSNSEDNDRSTQTASSSTTRTTRSVERYSQTNTEPSPSSSLIPSSRPITRSQKHLLADMELGVAKPLKRLQQGKETRSKKGMKITRKNTRQKNVAFRLQGRKSPRRNHTYKQDTRQ